MADPIKMKVGGDLIANVVVKGEVDPSAREAEDFVDDFPEETISTVSVEGDTKSVKKTNKDLKSVEKSAEKTSDSISNIGNTTKNDKIQKIIGRLNDSTKGINKAIQYGAGKRVAALYATEAEALENVKSKYKEYVDLRKSGYKEDDKLVKSVKKELVEQIGVYDTLRKMSGEKTNLGEVTDKIRGKYKDASTIKQILSDESIVKSARSAFRTDTLMPVFTAMRELESLGVNIQDLSKNFSTKGIFNSRDWNKYQEWSKTASSISSEIKDAKQRSKAYEEETKAFKERAKFEKQARDAGFSNLTRLGSSGSSAVFNRDLTNQIVKNSDVIGLLDATKVSMSENKMSVTRKKKGYTTTTNFRRNPETGDMEAVGTTISSEYLQNVKKATSLYNQIGKTREKLFAEQGKVSPDATRIASLQAELSGLASRYKECYEAAKSFLNVASGASGELGVDNAKSMQSFAKDVSESAKQTTKAVFTSRDALELTGATKELRGVMKTYTSGGFANIPYAQDVIRNFTSKAGALYASQGSASQADRAVLANVNKEVNDMLRSALARDLSQLKEASKSPEYVTEAQNNAKKAIKQTYEHIGTMANDMISGKNFNLEEELSTASKNAQRAMPAAKENISSLNANIQKTLTTQSSMNLQYQNQLKAISALLTNSKGNLSQESLSHFKNSYNQILGDIGQSNQLGKSFWGSFTDRIKSGSAQFIARYFSLYQVVDWAKQAVAAITDVNSKMIELKKVSSASDFDLANTLKVSEENARDLGATVSDVVSATADWSRLGYNLPDAQELGKVATLYKNVGDGITINDANESLISTLQGFQLEASDSMEIIDKFNEVANNFPIDSGGIGEALQRSAASFNAAHTDLSKSIALVTTTNSVVQDPDVVGTMWKTVSARLRGAKTELEDMGEDTDGMVTSTSKLRDLVKGITGFDIMESETEFKDIYDIVMGIGEQWDNINDIDKAECCLCA